MKTRLLAGVLLATAVAAFAQGKVEVINDPASLVELPNGQPVGNGSPLPSGLVLIVGFYGGTSSTALFEYSSALLNNPAIPAGQIGPFDVILNANPTGATAIPGIASGTAIGATTPWFQVRVWDNAYATYAAAVAAGGLAGEGPEFQMNPGPSLAFVPTAPPGPNSTWSETPIYLTPEPSTLALISIGAAILLNLRRRK